MINKCKVMRVESSNQNYHTTTYFSFKYENNFYIFAFENMPTLKSYNRVYFLCRYMKLILDLFLVLPFPLFIGLIYSNLTGASRLNFYLKNIL